MLPNTQTLRPETLCRPPGPRAAAIVCKSSGSGSGAVEKAGSDHSGCAPLRGLAATSLAADCLSIAAEGAAVAFEKIFERAARANSRSHALSHPLHPP